MNRSFLLSLSRSQSLGVLCILLPAIAFLSYQSLANVLSPDGGAACQRAANGQPPACSTCGTPNLPPPPPVAPPPPQPVQPTPPIVGYPSGCGAGGCVSSMALATWLVTEPDINLWLKDIPFFYNASRGRMVRFSLYYKNRHGTQGDVDNLEPKIFSVGKHWHSPWRSYLEAIPTESTNFWGYLGDGAARKYTVDQVQYDTLAKLTQVSGTNVITAQDGTTYRFGYTTNFGGITRHFLTSKEDLYGNAMTFQYEWTGGIRLSKVLDVDNRFVTFEYIQTGIYSNVISKVIGSFYNLTNQLEYDSSAQLTNIVDTLGLSGKMRYDGTNLTALVTPYGTNSFTYFSSGEMYAVQVNELGIRNHLYLYNPQVDGGKVPGNHTSYVPSTTNGSYFAIANTFDHLETDKRNSVNWGPRQFENLSDLVRTNLLAGSFNVSNLTSADYLKGRLSHWLKATGSSVPSRTISFLRDYSPDGTTQGQVQWYDYVGKASGSPEQEGTMISPRFNAWKLPNGECRFTYSERNVLGYPTLLVETYTSSAGTCLARTNQFEYAANNVDLTRHVQLIGSTIKQVSSNVFNAAHSVLTNFNALNEATSYTYNSKQQSTSITTPGGLTITNIYETSGTWSNFLAQRTQVQIGSTYSFTYSNGLAYTVTAPSGLTTTRTHDLLGRPLSILYPDGTSRSYTYINLDPNKFVDRLGYTNQYAYNGFHQQTQAIDPRNGTNTFTYCNCGSLDSRTDPLGKITSFAYDQAGRRCATLYPGGPSITNNYDLMGWVTNFADSAGNSLTNWLNNQGMVCIASNAVGCLYSAKYDIEDHTVETIDANNVSATFAYDELGRRAFITNGLGTISSSKYSSLGLLTQTNQMTNWVGYAYDLAGRKTAETNANGEVTQFKYDASGNLTNLIDSKGNNTFWRYDQYGRVTNKTDAVGNVIFTYAYDANGQLTNRWTPAKGNTAYRYDASGNLTNVDYATSADISMQYDSNNRLITMVDGVGITSYSYTDFGALLSEDGPWADDTVSYSYTSNQLRSQLKLLQPNSASWVQRYTYDQARRLTNISSPAGTFSYTYDPNQALLVRNLVLPTGSYITNTYDALGRLTTTTLKSSSGSMLNAHSYLYDDASRRTRQMRTGGDYVDYEYDKIGQLTEALGLESEGTTNRWHERFFYAYDTTGNLSNRVQNVHTNVFKVDSLNQLISIVGTNSSGTVAGTTSSAGTNVTVAANGGAPSEAIRYADATFARTNVSLLDGTNTFTALAQDSAGRSDTNSVTAYLPSVSIFIYDLNGNLRTNGHRIFEYDDENQLTRIVEPGAWKSEFTYDGKMRKRVRKEYAWQNNAWVQTAEVRYIYDGRLPIQERDALNVPNATCVRGRDQSGSLEGSGGISGLLARVETRLAFRNDGGANAYYHADANGNVTCLVDTNQIVVARYLYDPYGNEISATGPMANANLFRFSSKELHVASGLVYYLYRFYDPNLQRWLNRDPINEHGGINLYCSHLNSPVNVLDVFGMAATAGQPIQFPTGLQPIQATAAQPIEVPIRNPGPVGPGNDPPGIPIPPSPPGQGCSGPADVGNSRLNGFLWTNCCPGGKHSSCGDYDVCMEVTMSLGGSPGHKTYAWVPEPNPRCGPCQ